MTGEGADPPLVVLVPEPGDLHEDEAALRLAAAVAGPGLRSRGPAESRVDLLAAVDGVVRIRVATLERLDRIDPLEVFTIYDGQVVRAGDLVASVKIAPATRRRSRDPSGARRSPGPAVRWSASAAFRPGRVGVLVKESVHGPARERFEASVRAKVEGLGSTIVAISYVADDAVAVAAAFRALRRAGPRSSSRPARGAWTRRTRRSSRSTRSAGPSSGAACRPIRARCCGSPASGACRSSACRHAAPIRRRPPPTFSLPRLLAGEPASRATIARLGHGGILTRAMRFRFPAYARELDAPEG